jgi:hypothetical protein
MSSSTITSSPVTPSVSNAGLVLSLGGYLAVTVILKVSPVKDAFSPNAATLLGFLSAWVLVGTLVFITVRGERRSWQALALNQ